MTTPRHGVNRTRRVTGAGLGITLAVALASPMAAAPERIPFAGVFYPCGGTNGEELSGGNVLHLRDAENHNFSNPGDIAIDPADNPCWDLPFAALIEGEILVPLGTSW